MDKRKPGTTAALRIAQGALQRFARLAGAGKNLSGDDERRSGPGAGHVTSKVSKTILGGPSLVSAVMTKVLDDYAPTLRERIATQMAATVQTTQDALRDEVFLRKLFGAVHDCLPRPVHRFVSEHVFIEYCLKHRNKLLLPRPNVEN